jgi:regulator of ribonuclease activity A
MAFFTADLCDSNADKVAVLEPGFRHYGGASRCEGRIVTIRLDKNNSDLVELLRDEDGSGKIVVVDAGREYYAVVGENLMQFARQNNYGGIIINGFVRDTAQVQNIPVVLVALGTCPRKYIPVTPGDRGVPLSFGGVDFSQGDYLYADADGVIVTRDRLL